MTLFPTCVHLLSPSVLLSVNVAYSYQPFYLLCLFSLGKMPRSDTHNLLSHGDVLGAAYAHRHFLELRENFGELAWCASPPIHA